MNFRIQNSLNGLGLFSRKPFHENQVLFHLKGKLISCDEDEAIDDKTRSNAIRFDDEMYLSPEGELGNFINHSCEPNAYIKKKGKKLFLIAIRDIKKEEEITFDYSTIIAKDDSWKMKCQCKAKSCRKTIEQFASLSKALQKKYVKLGMVPDYILKN